ncbi:MAG: tetratricopeptide repeat protein [Candidatus Eiseniibacteriota bacterium]
MAEDRNQDDLLFREVDEDLRRDKYAQIWKKYGTLVVAAAIVVVGATAASVWWRDHQRGIREKDGDRYAAATALAEGGKTDQAITAFTALAQDGTPGYRTLARLREAALLAQKGDAKGAVAAYDALAKDDGTEKTFRDLAVVLATMVTLDSGDPAALTERLKPLTAEDNPWRYSALELTALLAERAGNKKAARDIYTRLADDSEAPGGIRVRARQMLGVLGES